MSFGKRCMHLFTLGALAYTGYKGYRYISAIINISKELPVYLKNVIGESPSMNLQVVFNRITVTLKFSADTIKNHSDISDTALEYISRYYPIFRADHVNVEVFEKQEIIEADVSETPETEEAEETEEVEKVEE